MADSIRITYNADGTKTRFVDGKKDTSFKGKWNAPNQITKSSSQQNEIGKTLAVTQPTPGGGTTTVTRSGQVTVRDKNRKVIERYQATQESTTAFIQQSKKNTSRKLEQQRAQKIRTNFLTEANKNTGVSLANSPYKRVYQNNRVVGVNDTLRKQSYAITPQELNILEQNENVKSQVKAYKKEQSRKIDESLNKPNIDKGKKGDSSLLKSINAQQKRERKFNEDVKKINERSGQVFDIVFGKDKSKSFVGEVTTSLATGLNPLVWGGTLSMIGDKLSVTTQATLGGRWRDIAQASKEAVFETGSTTLNPLTREGRITYTIAGLGALIPATTKTSKYVVEQNKFMNLVKVEALKPDYPFDISKTFEPIDTLMQPLEGVKQTQLIPKKLELVNMKRLGGFSEDFLKAYERKLKFDAPKTKIDKQINFPSIEKSKTIWKDLTKIKIKEYEPIIKYKQTQLSFDRGSKKISIGIKQTDSVLKQFAESQPIFKPKLESNVKTAIKGMRGDIQGGEGSSSLSKLDSYNNYIKNQKSLSLGSTSEFDKFGRMNLNKDGVFGNMNLGGTKQKTKLILLEEEYLFRSPSLKEGGILNLASENLRTFIKTNNFKFSFSPLSFSKLNTVQLQKPLQLQNSIQLQKTFQLQSQSQLQKSLQNQMSLQKQLQSQSQLQKQRTTQRQSTVQKQTVVQIQQQVQVQSQLQEQVQVQSQLQEQVQVQSQLQEQLQKQFQILKPQERLKIKRIPDISFKSVPKDKSIFNVFVKERGKFRLKSRALSQEDAFMTGANIVKRNSSASFKVVGDDDKPIDYDGFISGFRRSKKDRNVLVELSKFRINTLGELKQITMKGILASKNKRRSKGKTWRF